MYLFNEMHTDSEQIAVPHPPQCAHWGTFPPGEGIALRNPYKHQFIGQLRKTDMHKMENDCLSFRPSSAAGDIAGGMGHRP